MGAKRALLVGINAYPNLERQFPGSRPLTGCLKDVDTMAGHLKERGFEDIRRVMDGGEIPPTRQHIVAAMDALYDDVARAADTATSPDDADVVVFFFAGHGSEVRSRGVPGSPLQEHTFQTLVTSDSGRNLPRSQGVSLPNRDVFDFEIDAWVRRLRRLEPAPAVTLIFDCCHSAGLSSDQRGGDAATSTQDNDPPESERAAPTDLRKWEDLELDSKALVAWNELGRESIGQTRGVSGWRGHVLQEAVVMAACRNEETSMGNARGGFLTHALSKALKRYPGAPRWKDVFDPLTPERLADLKSSGRVHEHFAPVYSKVQGRNRRQHPVRHGDGPIFDLGHHDYGDGYPGSALKAPLKTFAVVIGIADYGGSWADLQNARRDAEAVAETLEGQQGYEVLRTSTGAKALCDGEATFLGIFRHLHRLRRAVSTYRKSAAGRHRGTAAVIYFAGHGASVPNTEQRRVKGYLIPHGGRLDAPQTWLSMALLRRFLTGPPPEDPRPKRRLRSRHLLLVLDCCFAGSIRFASLRQATTTARPIFASEFRRFVEGQAWQVLTSSSFHQSALDVVRDGRNPRQRGSRHSPFAQALIEALSSGVADTSDDQGRRDRLITAGELHRHLDHRLKIFDFQQPGLAPLSPGNRGQFFFRVPGWQTVAAPDPPLDVAHNPWPGFEPYDARLDPSSSASPPFHGRQAPLLQLLAALLVDEPGPRALVGASASGKTSLVLGGLWPLLQNLQSHRQTIRRWVSELRRTRLLLSPSNLAGVRRWMRQLQLPQLFHDADALHQRVVQWGRQQGNLSTGRDPSPTDLSGTLPPSLFDLIGTERDAEPPWWEAARLVDLLASPNDLLFHLRFWHQEPGLADLLLFEPEADETSAAAQHWTPWLQPWHGIYLRGDELLRSGSPLETLQQSIEDAPSDRPRLLILDDADGLLSSVEFRRHGLPMLEELEHLPAQDDASSLPWRILWVLGSRWQARTGDEVALPESLSALLSTHPDGDNPPWQRSVHLAPPTRQELRDTIEQPLLDRALLMAADLVDDLVDAAHGTVSPLALLGPCLNAMYRRAMEHLPRDERSLTAKHLGKVGSLTGPWLRRARRDVESADGDDQASMFRLLRRFAWRPHLALPPEAVLSVGATSTPPWLQRLLKNRAVVRDASGFRLGHPDLLDDWPAFTSWRRASAAAKWEPTLAELAPRALAWFLRAAGSDRDVSGLWDDHTQVLALLDLGGELNAAERSFLEASLARCRARLARRLAAEAQRAPQRRWNQSLLLAAQGLELAQTDDLRRSESLARESLRRLLTLSPLSLKVDLPGIARRLTWLDDERLHVLTTAQPTDVMLQESPGNGTDKARWHDDWAWQVDLALVDLAIERMDGTRGISELVPAPPTLDVRARPVHPHEAADLVLEATDPDRRRFARLIPFAQRLSLEQLEDPETIFLQGLQDGLRYLAWSPSGDWLAAVCQPEDAAAPFYGTAPPMQDAAAELRLWRCTPMEPPSSRLEVVSEPRQALFQQSPRDISLLAFVPNTFALFGLEGDRAPFGIDLEPSIPTQIDPSRWLGSPKARLENWQGRTFPAAHSTTARDDTDDAGISMTWIWSNRRSRGRDAFLLWDLQQPEAVRKIPSGGARNVHTVSRQGRFLVTEQGREFKLLNTEDGRELASYGAADLAEISSDERRLILAGNGGLRVVDLDAPQQEVSKLPLQADSPLEELKLAPNGGWLALRAREGKEPEFGLEPTKTAQDVEASDGSDGSDSPNVWLWFLPPEFPDVPTQPRLAVPGCRFAFDAAGGQWVVADATALQWFGLHRDGSCELLGRYELASYPTALSFHPRGDQVAVGGLDGSVVLLPRPEPGTSSPFDGTETLRRSDDNPQAQCVHALTFDDPGEHLAVALAAPQTHPKRHLGARLRARPQAEPRTLVVIYDLSSERLMQLARACAGRGLDEATWQRHMAPEPYRPGDLDAANDVMRERLGIPPAKPPQT